MTKRKRKGDPVSSGVVTRASRHDNKRARVKEIARKTLALEESVALRSNSAHADTAVVTPTKTNPNRKTKPKRKTKK